MNTMQLSTASMDDIVFEGRNQSYGAYVLRRIYSRHLVTGLILSVSLCLLLVGGPILVQHLWPAVVLAPPKPVEVDLVMTDYVLPKDEARPLEVQHQQKVVVTPHTDVPTTVVKDDKAKPLKEDPSITEVEPGAVTGPVAQDGDVNVAIAGPAGPGLSDSGTTAPAPSSAPFLHVEVMPEFAGGTEAMRRYMQRNLRYPRLALANSVSGKVFVAFTVLASGEISDVQVLKGLGYGTDEEAARVIKGMPTWTPGRQNSHPVSVRYTLPITFHYE